MTNKVSIVIPIYNALNELKECVDSIIKSNVTVDYEIILIDDCSPDHNVKKYLEGINNPKIKVFYNEKNLGFVKTVNKGMKLAESNDVLLLNSDTVVTQKFLDKIVKVAYSSPSIGTVTPLSNAASIMSIIEFCKEVPLPEGLDPETANKIVELIYAGEIISAPTANGYCMYIKRELLDLIGYFDEENFGKGYGEENDFSIRAMLNGYTNVCDNSTFIYHKGHSSFNTHEALNKKIDSVKAKHSSILHSRYPFWQQMIVDFIAHSLMKNKVKLFNIVYKLISSNKPTILILKHPEQVKGGIYLHTENLIKNLGDKYNFVVLYPINQDNFKLHFYINGKRFADEGIDLFNIHRYEEKVWFYNLIKDLNSLFNFVHIHIQHWLYFDIGILNLSKIINVPVSVTLHDLSLLFSGLDYIVNPTAHEDREIDTESVHIRRLNLLLKNVDYLIAPSNYVKNKFTSVFEDINIKVIENGVKKPKKKDLKSLSSLDVHDDSNINICYLGAVGRHKGIEDYFKLMKYFNQSKKEMLNFYVIGNDDHRLLDELDKKYKLKKNVDYVHDVYTKGYPYDLLLKYKINVVIVPSIVPESFCMTISEALALGIPVITSDLGAQGDRIRKLNAGWVYSDLEQLINTVVTMIENPDQIRQKRKFNIDNVKVNFVEDMVKKYDGIFSQSLNREESTVVGLDNIKISDELKLEFIYDDNRTGVVGVTPVLGTYYLKFVNLIKRNNLLYRIARKFAKFVLK